MGIVHTNLIKNTDLIEYLVSILNTSSRYPGGPKLDASTLSSFVFPNNQIDGKTKILERLWWDLIGAVKGEGNFAKDFKCFYCGVTLPGLCFPKKQIFGKGAETPMCPLCRMNEDFENAKLSKYVPPMLTTYEHLN